MVAIVVRGHRLCTWCKALQVVVLQEFLAFVFRHEPLLGLTEFKFIVLALWNIVQELFCHLPWEVNSVLKSMLHCFLDILEALVVDLLVTRAGLEGVLLEEVKVRW